MVFRGRHADFVRSLEAADGCASVPSIQLVVAAIRKVSASVGEAGAAMVGEVEMGEMGGGRRAAVVARRREVLSI